MVWSISLPASSGLFRMSLFQFVALVFLGQRPSGPAATVIVAEASTGWPRCGSNNIILYLRGPRRKYHCAKSTMKERSACGRLNSTLASLANLTWPGPKFGKCWILF